MVRDRNTNSLEGCPMHCLLPVVSFPAMHGAGAMTFLVETSYLEYVLPTTITLTICLSSLTYGLSMTLHRENGLRQWLIKPGKQRLIYSLQLKTPVTQSHSHWSRSISSSVCYKDALRDTATIITMFVFVLYGVLHGTHGFRTHRAWRT